MENSKHLEIIKKAIYHILQEETYGTIMQSRLMSVIELFDIAKEINSKQLQLEYARGRNDVLQEIVNRSSITSPEIIPSKPEFSDISKHMRSMLKINLAKNYDLSTRIKNVFKAREIVTVGDLVSHEKEELKRLKCLGQQSLDFLENIVDSLGLNFGMNVEKYRLNED